MPSRSPVSNRYPFHTAFGVALEPPLPQVHQQEGEVVEDVDAGDLVVELDRVEQRRLPRPQHDVAQMEVAVTLPDEAAVATGVEQDSPPIEKAV